MIIGDGWVSELKTLVVGSGVACVAGTYPEPTNTEYPGCSAEDPELALQPVPQRFRPSQVHGADDGSACHDVLDKSLVGIAEPVPDMDPASSCDLLST